MFVKQVFLTVRGEDKLQIFENQELRQIFGSKRDEGSHKCRILCNEVICDIFSSNIYVEEVTVGWT
jgi:hypothetical protein